MKRTWDVISSGMETTCKVLELGERAEAFMDNVLNDEEKMETLKSKLRLLEGVKADKVKELQAGVSRTGKKPLNELQIWSSEVATVKAKVENLEQEVIQGGLIGKLLGQRVKKLIKEVTDLIDGSARFQGQLVSDAGDSIRVALLAPKLVGEAFKKNREKVLQYLEEDEGLTIGIWGMGGVGKTTLVTHIHNDLLRKKKNVYWITVSQDFSISKLQNQIAKVIGRDISSEDDEKKRAALLWNALSTKPKFVLILDDLWEPFSLEKVGIPIPEENGCKLVLTSRSLEVCNKMGCHKKIKLERLSEEEAWNLFQEKLGEQIPANVQRIARSITRECAGLPLGIITISGCMKGVDDLSEWRNTLRELEESKATEGDMELEVFRILKFSYDRLKNPALEKCFLYCALYPEDCEIRRVMLIDYLIDEGVIKERSRQAEFDKGHTMLNKLEKVCLLEGIIDDKDYQCVKMHDLIRDMAIQMMKADTLVCTHSEGILDCESWATNLERISVFGSIEEICPSNHSPACSRLSSLLLRCTFFERILNPFFEQLQGLKILDLSYNYYIEELPDSVSNLTNITTLSLRCCGMLKGLPSLEKLKALKKLDLCGTGLVELPQGIEFLSNLKYLSLYMTSVQFPPGILPNLSSLQVLLLNIDSSIKGEEVASLRKLEKLCCCLSDFNEFSEYFQYSEERNELSLRNRDFGSHMLNDYFLFMGIGSYWPSIRCNVEVKFDDDFEKMLDANEELEFVLGKRVSLGAYSINKRIYSLEVELIEIQSYHTGWLCLENKSAVKMLEIFTCVGIECLFSLSSSSILEGLEMIKISDSRDLQILISTPTPTAAVPNGTFSLLEIFEICGCPSMKKLFPPSLISNLQNLEEISVVNCGSMEELIAMEEEQESHHSDVTSPFALPKLHSFVLRKLPELKSICYRKMICNSLRYFKICDCPKLKRIPMSLTLVENDQIAPLSSLEKIDIEPKEWWEMVELDHPIAKNILSPFVVFDTCWWDIISSVSDMSESSSESDMKESSIESEFVDYLMVQTRLLQFYKLILLHVCALYVLFHVPRFYICFT